MCIRDRLYTVTDSGAVAEIDALINKAGGENADHGNAEGDPLYTYVYLSLIHI